MAALNDPAALAILSGRISDTCPDAGHEPDTPFVRRTDSYLIGLGLWSTQVCMPRFRETLWFKKGSEAPAEAPPVGDAERPIEDRYEDDGSISLIDHVQFSVVTGTTQPVRIFKKMDAAPEADDTMHIVVKQMSRGRGKMYAMIAASMACAAVVAAMIVA